MRSQWVVCLTEIQSPKFQSGKFGCVPPWWAHTGSSPLRAANVRFARVYISEVILEARRINRVLALSKWSISLTLSLTRGVCIERRWRQAASCRSANNCGVHSDRVRCEKFSPLTNYKCSIQMSGLFCCLNEWGRAWLLFSLTHLEEQ